MLGSIVTIFLVCLALILLSLKFYILQETVYEKSVLEDTQKKYQTDDFMSLLDSIKRYNEDLSRIDNFYKKDAYISSALKTIFDIERPGGISFSSIVLERLKEEKIKANLYGESSNRDELLSYKDNISSQKSIYNIYLPPDNLIKPRNISFNMTFEINSAK